MKLPSLLATGLLVAATAGYANPVADLQEVGRASLRVLFWSVFDSTLYSTDGEFRQVTPGLALEIRYRRNISAAALVDSTRDEWRKQSLCGAFCEAWLQQAGALWPDIEKGDRLLLRVGDDLSSEFHFNDQFIGRIADPQFTESFLAIFISDDSSYPRLRRELLGRVR